MSETAQRRVLVAGIGNVFFGDDGFGVEVARRLSVGAVPLAPGVRVIDVGIRTLHLAYELAGGGYDLVILVDAVTRGESPGPLFVIEADRPDDDPGSFPVDAHGVRTDQLLAMARALGGGTPIERVLIVGCEPADLTEGMGLTAAVAATIESAAERVMQLASESVSACRS
jgi:hydrogenase maturation protease